jgi:hypothetical protein
MKDHFAGSMTAIGVAHHLIFSHRGKTHEQVFVRLRDDFAEDPEVLRGLLHDFRCRGRCLRNTTAFLARSSGGSSCCWKILQAVNWQGSKSLKPSSWEFRALLSHLLRASERFGVPSYEKGLRWWRALSRKLEMTVRRLKHPQL